MRIKTSVLMGVLVSTLSLCAMQPEDVSFERGLGLDYVESAHELAAKGWHAGSLREALYTRDLESYISWLARDVQNIIFNTLAPSIPSGLHASIKSENPLVNCPDYIASLLPDSEDEKSNVLLRAYKEKDLKSLRVLAACSARLKDDKDARAFESMKSFSSSIFNSMRGDNLLYPGILKIESYLIAGSQKNKETVFLNEIENSRNQYRKSDEDGTASRPFSLRGFEERLLALFFTAVIYDCRCIAWLCIKSRVQINNEFYFKYKNGSVMTPLSAALAAGHWQMASLLLRHGADPDKTTVYHVNRIGRSYLGYDIRYRGYGFGVPGPHKPPFNGWSSLMIAIYLHVNRYHPEFMRALIQKSRCDFTNVKGDTPLAIAARCNNQCAISELIEKGASVNHVNCIGKTPLMLAAKYGHEKAISLLVDAGAEIDKRDHLGNGALYHALYSGNTECVIALIDRLFAY